MFGFILLTVGSGAMIVTATIKRRPKQPLVDILLSKEKKGRFLNPPFLQQIYPKAKQMVLQLTSVIETSKHHQKSKEEIAAWSHLVQATFAVGLTALGSLYYTPLYILSLLFVAAPFIHHYQLAWRSLVHEKRVDANVLFVAFVAAAVFGSSFLTMMIGGWFRVLANWLVIKTEDHSKREVLDLLGQQNRFVWMLVDGTEIEVPIEQVQVGDVVVVYAGQIVPIDGVIVEGVAAIDQKMLTGESQPVDKEVGDLALASTMVLSGRICLQVERTGQSTVVAKIGELLTTTSDFKETIQSRADALNDELSLPFLLFSVAVFPFIGLDRVLGILMAMPGYRMVLFGPLNMLGYLHLAARSSILVKDGRSLELLQTIDTVVFDKTGTLTLEQPTVHSIYTCSETDTRYDSRDVLTYAAAAEAKQSHPIALAILQAAADQQIPLTVIDDMHYEIGYGVEAVMQGQKIWVGSHRFMHMQEIAIPPEIEAIQVESHAKGHTLVMVAVDKQQGDKQSDKQLVGAIELKPTVRPEAQLIVDDLRTRGFSLYMISGDHDAPTRHLSDELGMDGYFAEVLPEEKSTFVKQLQDDGHAVCFIGDGINDSIALKQADVSISLRGATTIATDTAQIVLMDEHLQQLPRLFTLADEFNDNMNACFLAATIPNLFIIGGALFLGWGFMTSTLLVQVSSPFVFYTILRPLLKTDSSEARYTDKFGHGSYGQQ
ncbi:MAG: heavy metal translocating P-type ATPase [Chloroflexota bacterium]